MELSRIWSTSAGHLLVLLLGPPVLAQQIFTDDFESGRICNTWSSSTGAVQRCNGLDNDCDGSVDYGCECDPLAQNCPDPDHGCYLSLTAATTLCALPNSGNPTLPPPGVQDEPCEFINGCAKGYGCTLLAQEFPPEFVCAFFCHPDGGTPSCATGATPSHQCARIRDYYSDSGAIPPEIGMCVLPP